MAEPNLTVMNNELPQIVEFISQYMVKVIFVLTHRKCLTFIPLSYVYASGGIMLGSIRPSIHTYMASL